MPKTGTRNRVARSAARKWSGLDRNLVHRTRRILPSRRQFTCLVQSMKGEISQKREREEKTSLCTDYNANKGKRVVNPLQVAHRFNPALFIVRLHLMYNYVGDHCDDRQEPAHQIKVQSTRLLVEGVYDEFVQVEAFAQHPAVVGEFGEFDEDGQEDAPA